MARGGEGPDGGHRSTPICWSIRAISKPPDGRFHKSSISSTTPLCERPSCGDDALGAAPPFVSRHGFGVFAWYRIALGGLALALLVLLR